MAKKKRTLHFSLFTSLGFFPKKEKKKEKLHHFSPLAFSFLSLSSLRTTNYTNFDLFLNNNKCYLFYFFLRARRVTEVADEMPAAEAQEQSQAEDTIHHSAATGPRTEIPVQAVSLHCGTGWILLFSESNRDAGQNMVPEQEGERKETERSRNRED